MSKGEEGYYQCFVNELRLTKKFKGIEEAKSAGVKMAFKLASLASEQLKNFLEDSRD